MSSSQSVVDIDGDTMEGGGQILRLAMGLSALFCKNIRVYNIRAKRATPGLRAQHLCGLKLIRDLSNGQLSNAEVGSVEINFNPSKIKAGQYAADTKTAGSIGLLFQISLPCLLFTDQKCSVELRGGTDAEFAPQIDYLTQVFRKQSKRFGIDVDCVVNKRGYYPKGGGSVTVQTQPIQCLSPVEMLERGNITKITGKSFVAGVLPIKVAHEMAESARSIIQANYPDVELNIDVVKEKPNDAFGTGSGIILIAESENGYQLAGSAIGRKGVHSHKVGKDAAAMLSKNINHGGCVDEFLQDQLIIFLALANGTSRVKTGPISLHTKTAIYVAELLTEAKFKIEECAETDMCIIECNGVGFKCKT